MQDALGSGKRLTVGSRLVSTIRVSGVGIAGRCLKAITVAVLARALGPSDFGQFSVAFSIAMVAAFIPLVGLDQSVIRFGSPLDAGTAWNRAYRPAVCFVVIASIVTAGGMSLAAPAIASLLHYGDGFVEGFRAVAATIPPYNAAVIAASFLLAAGRPGLAALIQEGVAPLVTLALVGAFAAAGGSWSWMAAAAISGFSVASVAAHHFGRRLARTHERNRSPAAQVRTLRAMLRFGYPVMVIGLLAFAAFSIDMAIVARLTSDSEAGVYAIANRFSALATVLQFGLVAVFVPAIAELCERKAMSSLSELLAGSTRLLLGLVVPVAGIAVLLAPEFLELLGSDFGSAIFPLSVLVIGHSAATATLLWGYTLVMLGLQKLDILNHVALLAIIVFGGYVATSLAGSLGMALVVALGLVLVNGAKLLELRRYLPELELPASSLLRTALVGGVVVVMSTAPAPLWARAVIVLALVLFCAAPARSLLTRPPEAMQA